MPERTRNELGPPERLDRVLHVTTAKAWLALCVLMLLSSAVVVWAVVGEVSTYVRADGILLSRGGQVVDAISPDEGQLARVLPGLGDTVAEGEVVAEILDPGTVKRHAGARALADDRAQALRDREADAQAENLLMEKTVAEQRARLDELERTARHLIESARERLEVHQKLFEEQRIDRAAIERDELALDLERRNLFDVLRRRDQLETNELRRRNDLRERISDASAEQVEAEARVHEIAARIEAWRIRAPVSGRVTEVKAQVGATLDPGEAVLSIETGGKGMDVLIYVPPADGKRVKTGMPALVSPATARREEFGSMKGTVESVSEFPSSLTGMVATLRNEDLARTFSQSGPPYLGRVALTPDASTESGFAWTSPRAAEVNVTPGTLAKIEIEVSSKPPIALVIPLLKKAFGN